MAFDEITIVILVGMLVLTLGAVFFVGMAESEDRIGCRLNDIVNSLMAVPQPCHAPVKPSRK